MSKVLHLSKLSRGHVEMSENGSRLDIIADQSERPLIRTSGGNQSNHVPKTYSTKRGPLILFAETDLLKKSRANLRRDKRIIHPASLISPPPLKLGELKRSILAYGGTPENQFADGIVDEDGTFIYMKIPSKKRSQPSKYAGMNPNVLLKKRNLITSMDEKRRDLDSITESEYSSSRVHRYSKMKTHVLSDEISLIPPVYRNPDMNQHASTALTNTYRFFQIDNTLPGYESENREALHSQHYGTLQIIDSKGSHLAYDALEKSEKEKVLADLLIQSALQNISDQQNIEVFEDALNRVREVDASHSYASVDAPTLMEESSVPLMLSDTTSDNQPMTKSRRNSSESTPQQQYMFGKMQGTKWARNRPLHSTAMPTKSKQQTMENEQQSEEFSDEFTQTTSDYVHSKLFRASRLLAPISASTHHDSSTIRHAPIKLLAQVRKTHENDLNPPKIARRDDNITQFKLIPGPNQSREERPKNESAVDEKGKLEVQPFSRQRSSKSSRKNVSRQDTGKTMTSNRCVSSPLTVHDEAERLLEIDSVIDEDDDNDGDDENTTQTTKVDPVEEDFVRNATHSAHTKTDNEFDHRLHPSEMNVHEDPPPPPPVEIQVQRSAYTHRSHNTAKSKGSSIGPTGALLIAPDGEVLNVGGPAGHTESGHFDEYFNGRDGFNQQSSTHSLGIDNSDQQTAFIAPCVPMILGAKRERLPDETIVRRTINFNGGDFNSQIGLHSWSYEIPVEQRRVAPQLFPPIPPPPPLGLSGFTARKQYHQPKRVSHEVHDHAMVHSTLSTHSEAIPQSRIVTQLYPKTGTRLESESPLFAFTSWHYRHPPTPPAIKRPYLFRPDHRPTGAVGHKHQMGDHETMIRRTIDVHAGDIDASLSFTIWVYDIWINDLVRNGADPNYIKEVKSLFDLFKARRVSRVDLQDKEFLSALAHHAQALARIILKRSDSGYHLAEDAQLAIIENIRNLKHLLDQRLATVSDDVYREVLRETLEHVLAKGNLEHLQITDEILMALMDYPIEAFEIYCDPNTNEEYIRLKSAYRVRKNKIKGKKTKKKTKTIIMSEEISIDDLESFIDEQTGESFYRFRADVVAQKGFTDLMEINFDIIYDRGSGSEWIEIKSVPDYFDFQVEIFLDPDTGKQIIVWRREVLKTPPMIQSDIAMDDFELVTDERTGETVLRLRADVAERKGLTGMRQMNFEMAVDPNTGQTVIRIKDDGLNSVGNRVEIVTDAITGKQTIRMVVDDDNEGTSEPIVTIIENDIDFNDFERVIDSRTGREILRMKVDVLKAKGLEELANAEFEVIVDSVTGQSRVVLKTSQIDVNDGNNTHFEIIVDIVTGKQKIIKKTIVEPENDHVDVVESQLNADDFERTIDPNTGAEVLRLKKGAAARKGLTDLLNVQFEMVTGADGKQSIVVKGGENQGNTGQAKFELITDAAGRTTIKVKKEPSPTPELEVTEKSINIDDFEETIDPKTGLTVLKLKADVAKRAGMTELLDAQFETYIDTKTGQQAVRIKANSNSKHDDVKFEIVTDASGKQILRMVQEIPKTVEVTSSDVSTNDFEEVIDEKTGETVLRMKKEVAERKGFADMDKVEFECVIDEKTGQQGIQIKSNAGKLNKAHVSFEMVTDPITGQQTLRMKQEVETKFETIESDLAKTDFEVVIDQVTGERILKLTAEAAARKGLTDLRDVAFEVYVDPKTGKEQMRMKGGNQTGKLEGDQKFEIFVDPKTGQQKIVLKRPKDRTPPPMEKSIDENDFVKVIDPTTGKESYRLTDEAIRRKGLNNVKDVEFDMQIDSKTGKAVMKPKVNLVNGKKVEVIVDPKTGEQTIRIVQEKASEKLATITTTIDLDDGAFTSQVDPKTGKRIINLNKDLVDNYGLENVEFEQAVDEKTGQTIYRMKPAIGKDGKVYELVTDAKTGKQSLQVKESVTQQQFANLVQKREAKGLRAPKTVGDKTQLSANSPTETAAHNNTGATPTPDAYAASTTRSKGQVTFKNQPIRVKSPSGREYEIEWTADDEKELSGMTVYEQRKRKEQMLADKKRQVAEMKRQEQIAIQQRLKKQRESLVGLLDQSSGLFNKEDQDRERDLRKLDADREGLTEEEYQARRKKLFAERTRVLKGAYDRKMDGLKEKTDVNHLNGDQAAHLEEQLEAQIRAEEELLLSMMNPEEREDYIRARNEERARQRLLLERERVQREEELQAALAETKRMAATRAADIMAKELQKRSENSMYAELKDLVTEQKVSRAFTYSYFSLLQYLPPTSPNPTD